MDLIRISLSHFPREIKANADEGENSAAAKNASVFPRFGRMKRPLHSIPRAALSAHTQSEVHSVKAIIIALIVVGIVGLILSAVLPIVGIPGIIGSVAALLAGIGFLIFRCFCCRN